MDLVTGASGFLGSHITERLTQEGRDVRVLVRPSSDTTYLDTLGGIEKFHGDLTDPASCQKACEGIDTVYHAAAKVGDWGPWDEFQVHTIDATRNLAKAALAAGVRRFVQISSISAYGHPNGKGLVLDERAELGVNVHKWSYYTHAKVAAERLLWAMHREKGFPLTVIRPSWIYGPRDRTSIARLHRMITTGKIKILGDGTNRLNTVFAPHIADACLLAAQNDKAVGEAYNISNDGEITQEEFVSLWSKAFGCPPPKKHVPFGVAVTAGLVCECVARALRQKKPPFITRYSVWLMGRDVFFSTEKARKELGWQPRLSYEETVPLTAKWFLEHGQG
ncbi:MAG: NAD-dependent epimerase/dehydratase family protein [Sedimentisphaerales bacterium]|nr:NAD-dependent epimerase/dehydratase family protein [Sedimentisphaerales bacterium]